MKIPRFPVAALMGLVLVVALLFGSLRFASPPRAALVLGATWIVISLAILAAVYRRGRAGAFWMGFALFGSGYLALTSAVWWPGAEQQASLPTSMALEMALPYLDRTEGPTGGFTGKVAPRTWSEVLLNDPDAPNRKIRAILEAPVSMPFAQETPLEDVLKYIKAATIRPQYPNGLPIYVEPLGLQEAEKTASSPVQLDLDGVPLKTTLTLILKQLGLTYSVSDGLVTITSKNDAGSFNSDAYHRIGHCWWAIFLGILGGLAARRLEDTRPGPDGRTEVTG